MIELGTTVKIGEHEYYIVHELETSCGSNFYYLALKYYCGDVPFEPSFKDKESHLATLCSVWLIYDVPSEITALCNAVPCDNCEMYCKCFVPTKEMCEGGFDYFSTEENRIFRDPSGKAHAWWTATALSPTAMWGVDADGSFIYSSDSDPGSSYAFRPCLCVSKGVFEKGLI